MPRCHVGKLRHDLQDLINEHLDHPHDCRLPRSLADRGGSLHELHHPRPLEHGPGELALSLDEQLGHRHLEHLLPPQQVGEPQVRVGLLLTPHERQRHAQPASHVAERHALLPPHVGDSVKRGLPPSDEPVGVIHRTGRASEIGMFAIGDGQRIRESVVRIVKPVLAVAVVVHSGHAGFLPRRSCRHWVKRRLFAAVRSNTRAACGSFAHI